MFCALKQIPWRMSVFIEVLFTKEWKQPNCSSIDGRSEYTLHFYNTLWGFKVLFPYIISFAFQKYP